MEGWQEAKAAGQDEGQETMGSGEDGVRRKKRAKEDPHVAPRYPPSPQEQRLSPKASLSALSVADKRVCQRLPTTPEL